ncbi:uncharacterized protein L969DRAFT_85130 [Mixia osmundae IAM 14324]|uniref:Uncharacterized protein n=1 Tax=Mixia osmundae (strain CBS 9802 / IAM 14324 / JCM 22182 / KY 12970) TaxID=764103 RepID=G7DXY5_MIXOS|nr:uncharacterized protein L969DRAFT_85130 [Mixia osmundae IAM 14324]KEI41347.1 hypothetical protein L969DRAFT_85130 [Mixia osmundae IAM 14324]GAA95445.1 hypothetical protein E5Q_02099 [Mixia osmundae IAM 14324]
MSALNHHQVALDALNGRRSSMTGGHLLPSPPDSPARCSDELADDSIEAMSTPLKHQSSGFDCSEIYQRDDGDSELTEEMRQALSDRDARRAIKHRRHRQAVVVSSPPLQPWNDEPVASACPWSKTDDNVLPGTGQTATVAPFKSESTSTFINSRGVGLGLTFTSSSTVQSWTDRSEEEESSCPPAFFPNQRVSFSPVLQVRERLGLPIASSEAAAESAPREEVSKMILGVTGVVEALEPCATTGVSRVTNARVVADFTTDVSGGLAIWQRDAAAVLSARQKQKQREQADARRRAVLADEPEASDIVREPSRSDIASARALDDGSLPSGKYVLPLSMRIPDHNRLPPSFESAHFRLRYSMSIALISNRKQNNKPRVIKQYDIPFHVLPSTSPSGPPCIMPTRFAESVGESRHIGILSTLSSAFRGMALSPRLNSTETSEAHINTETSTPARAAGAASHHTIIPYLPTSSFSPSAQASVPLSLRIDSSTAATGQDLYIRASIVKRIYVRDSSKSPDDEIRHWADHIDVTSAQMEDHILSRCLKSEETLVSRFGVIPWHLREHQSAQITIEGLALPLTREDSNSSWTHGYSTALSLRPEAMRNTNGSDDTTTWFAPSLRNPQLNNKTCARHLFCASRFFVCIEVGFAHDLTRTLEQLNIPVAKAGRFSKPVFDDCNSVYNRPFGAALPRRSSLETMLSSSLDLDLSGRLLSSQSSLPRRSLSQTAAASGPVEAELLHKPRLPLVLPGLKHLEVGISVGSVAEPSLNCFEVLPRRQTYDPALGSQDESGVSAADISPSASVQESDKAWICAPPPYIQALRSAPAYLSA